tara:strand:- start:1235 stop:2248 length:1014 start_codon:yes stop_codon:yes gene_type:complete
MKNKTKEIIGAVLCILWILIIQVSGIFPSNNNGIVYALVAPFLGPAMLNVITGAMGGVLAGAKYASFAFGGRARNQLEMDKLFRERHADDEARRTKSNLSRLTNMYSNLSMSNPYLNMENAMEDLTINQNQYQFQRQAFQQSQKNILGALRPTAGASGVASLAQSLVRQNQVSEQQMAANIAREESRNRNLALQQREGLERLEREGRRIPINFEAQKMQTLIGMEQQEMMMNKELQQKYYEGEMGRASSALQTSVGIQSQMAGMLSDRRLKKNIKHIGNSPSGIRIYKFEYINDSLGKGMYQGVMSDEIPKEAIIKHLSGYDAVDYSKLDVEFKNII